MPMYEVITPLLDGGPAPIAPGKAVELDAADGDALVLLGALVRLPEGEAATEVAIDRMTRAQLVEVATRLGLPVADNDTKAILTAAINAKRSEAA